MRLEGSGSGKRNAKRLRKEMTPPEIGLWLALRRNEAGLHFRKQHAVNDYVLDSTARLQNSRSKSMARRTLAATAQNEMPSATRGLQHRGYVSCAIRRARC
jgi:hypothetical protein